MIAYLEGNLTHKSATLVHLDIGGIAYEVNVSLHTYTKIESLEKVRLYTRLIIRENDHTLYGFFDLEEKELFSKLLSVKGIGPNTARVILSYLTPIETKKAILHDNVAAFKKVKGVGPKTAKQIILDLKDKISKEQLEIGPLKLPAEEVTEGSALRSECISALMNLGFQKAQVVKLVDRALAENEEITQVEVLLRTILKQL